ncbi:hypothetical protein HPT25_21060 [Bacillus sp. BRMEA1]|uniref:hypothetical protein n=1 Tax=Neobacillus endophyticus TaxID=2738405 RepID=UPI0015646B89|nr:hypothetical protein [Neobacillus endophyticus]NRD79829.1 hypothetical protein [Neobacillus endophyticus]
MQISSLNGSYQAQTLSNKSRIEGSPAEEANESAAEKAAERSNRAQKTAMATSTGIGTNIDITA